jgi:hypothetical protein
MLAAVHEPAYVRQVLDAAVPPGVERVIGMAVTRDVSDRVQVAVGSTLMAARLALRHGPACNTAGGSHHAGPKGGASLCVFNDIGVVARAMIDTGEIRQALVVDLDGTVRRPTPGARAWRDRPTERGLTSTCRHDRRDDGRSTASRPFRVVRGGRACRHLAQAKPRRPTHDL